MIYAFGIIGAAYARLRRTVPEFNLDIARLANFTAGPRSIDKARRMLGFQPRDTDPMAAIAEHYLRRTTVDRRMPAEGAPA